MYCVAYQVRINKRWHVQWFSKIENAENAYAMAKSATIGDESEFISAVFMTVNAHARAEGFMPFQFSE